MPKYNYKALKQDGSIFDGVLTAKSTNEVVQFLKSNDNYPVEIKRVQESSSMDIVLNNKAKSKDLAIFSKQLSAMLDSGMPIINAMDIMMTQSTSKLLRNTSADIYENLQKGSMFSECMKQHPNVFPELMVHMVESGEASGTMDAVLKKLAIHYEKENKIKNKVRGATIYPMILSIAAVVMVIFMLIFVLPTFVSMFDSSDVDLPQLTQVVLNISESIKQFWYIYGFAIIALAFATRSFIGTPDGRLMIDRLKYKIPVLKNYTTMMVTSRFTRTLATLLFSGVPLLQALENVSKVLGNKVAENAVLIVRDEVQRGQELAVPIKRTGIFPPMVDNMIRIGEEAGTLDDILEKTADFFDEELDAAVSRLTTMFEPLLIVVMGLVLGTLVIAMALPLFDVMKTVT